MDIEIIEESGYENALRGIGMSYDRENILLSDLHSTALILAPKNGGHNKFLESLNVSIRINAPLYFWKEFDTYRAGITKQSESTMHTITKREFKKEHFEGGYTGVTFETLNDLNWIRTQFFSPSNSKKNCFDMIIKRLPSSFLQARRITTNYKTIANMIYQRRNHKLMEWIDFVDHMKNLDHFCFIEHLYK